MTWHYQIIKTKDLHGDDLFGVYEVYCGKDNKPHSWTAEPIDLGKFETLTEIYDAITMIKRDIEKHCVLKIKKNKLIEDK